MTRHEDAESFLADFKKLETEHKRAFKKVVLEKFAPARDEWAQAQADRTSYVWPTSLRVDEMRRAAGIMEMTWSFASPDGRATFQFVRERGEWICRWRRVKAVVPGTALFDCGNIDVRRPPGPPRIGGCHCQS